MTAAVSRIIERAITGLENESQAERLTVWSGICEITPEEDPLGKLARAHRLCIEQEMELQRDFLGALSQRKN